MAKKIALGLLVLLAALTVDFLRQEVFAWMDSRLGGGTTFCNFPEPAGGTLPAGMPSGMAPEDNGSWAPTPHLPQARGRNCFCPVLPGLPIARAGPPFQSVVFPAFPQDAFVLHPDGHLVGIEVLQQGDGILP